jgi:hypothetical protein
MKDNQLIAEFMELPLVPCNIATEDGDVTEGYWHPKVSMPCTIDGLRYKYSWDWLMPVVHKCRLESRCEYDEDDNWNEIHWSLEECNLDKTYKAVVQFINEFNKN